jgi:hypothetical protein
MCTEPAVSPGNISERLPDLVISLAARRLAEIPPCISMRRAPNSRRSNIPEQATTNRRPTSMG